MGANIGTTITALLAMLNMDFSAKKAALSHVLFNVGGVVIALPFLLIFGGMLNEIDLDPAIVLANVHLAFNVITTLIFLALIKPFTRLIDLLLGEEKRDFERLPLPVFEEDIPYERIRADLRANRNDLLEFLRESYGIVSLSIESGYRSISETASKRLEYIGFLEREYMDYFSRAVLSVTHEDESRDLMRLNTQYDYLFQIYDSIDDIFSAKRILDANYVELQGDVLLMIRGISSQTLAQFDEIHRSLIEGTRLNAEEWEQETRDFMDEVNRNLLRLLTHPDRRDAGALSNIVTFSRRLQDKLVNFAELVEARSENVRKTEGDLADTSKADDSRTIPD